MNFSKIQTRISIRLGESELMDGTMKGIYFFGWLLLPVVFGAVNVIAAEPPVRIGYVAAGTA